MLARHAQSRYGERHNAYTVHPPTKMLDLLLHAREVLFT